MTDLIKDMKWLAICDTVISNGTLEMSDITVGISQMEIWIREGLCGDRVGLSSCY